MSPTDEKQTPNGLYQLYESKCDDRYNRKCIDGSITGCGNCVGYCSYEEHPGFLTKELRKQHDCVVKGCDYYVPKQKERPKTIIRLAEQSESILARARELTKNINGIYVVKSTMQSHFSYTLYFVTITNDYSLERTAETLSDEFSVEICFERLDYDYNVCLEIICKKD